MHSLRRATVLALAAAWLAASSTPRGQQEAPRPGLAVIIVVDQMRADYVDHFRGQWTGGLKRLATEGAWFSRAAYPYLTTVTCAGHATVGTGAFPHTHGIFQNAWYDRERSAAVACADDAQAAVVRYGEAGAAGATSGSDSAARLLLPTFADEMRARRSARVVTMSIKQRSAIMLAGHGGDAVTWLSDSLDGWETSSAYASKPVDAVQAFVAANPIAADYGKTWTRLLPDAQYQQPDDGLAEAPPQGWTRTFPHELTSPSGRADAAFYDHWQDSPYADAYLGRFAAAMVESMQLGKHEGTDVLGIGFTSPDSVGHAYGPRSQEVQDMYAHLDRTMGTLFERLDALVGRDRYVVGLSADHGVTPLPEQLLKEGQDAGRLSSNAFRTAVEQLAQAELGPGKYLASLSGNDIYFEPGVYGRLKAKPGAIARVLAAIVATPGVDRAFFSEQLTGSATSSDAVLRAAALSYVSGRSGDLVLALKRGWMFSPAGTTHGSASPDDQRVPVLFMGYGIKRGEYPGPATPADIAPTLAAICGIDLPKAEGRALRDALASTAAR